VVSEFLPFVDVADVNFDNRPLECVERIEDRNRCM
jgi:hypothetical protein